MLMLTTVRMKALVKVLVQPSRRSDPFFIGDIAGCGWHGQCG
jgi:hypothetical protein